VLFPVESYPAMKAYWDQLNKQDSHSIALKQAVVSSN